MRLSAVVMLAVLCGCSKTAPTAPSAVTGATLIVYVQNPDGTPNRDAYVELYDANPEEDRYRDLDRDSVRESQYGTVCLGPVWRFATELVVSCDGYKTLYFPMRLHPGENVRVVKLPGFDKPPAREGLEGPNLADIPDESSI